MSRKAIMMPPFRLSVVIGLSVIAWVLSTSGHASEHQQAIGEAVAKLPIFDAHMHYKEPAWQPFPVQTVIELMDKSGVAMALVSSSPDDGTIMLWEYAPERIVPELRPYHGQAGAANWTKAPGGLGEMDRFGALGRRLVIKDLVLLADIPLAFQEIPRHRSQQQPRGGAACANPHRNDTVRTRETNLLHRNVQKF